MKAPAEETLRRLDEELAGVGFSSKEIRQIAPQITAWVEQVATLDEIDLAEVESSLIYSLEE